MISHLDFHAGTRNHRRLIWRVSAVSPTETSLSACRCLGLRLLQTCTYPATTTSSANTGHAPRSAFPSPSFSLQPTQLAHGFTNGSGACSSSIMALRLVLSLRLSSSVCCSSCRTGRSAQPKAAAPCERRNYASSFDFLPLAVTARTGRTIQKLLLLEAQVCGSNPARRPVPNVTKFLLPRHDQTLKAFV